MTYKEAIENLKALKEYFEVKSGGSYPMCFDAAIDALEKHISKHSNVEVDGNKVGTWDAFITIFSGTGDNAKIIRFIHNADGTDNDIFITLEDCRKMFEQKYGKQLSLCVWFDDWTHGELYNYGNHGKCWEKIGETIGFA